VTRSIRICASLILVLLNLGAAQGVAQNIAHHETVANRARPAFDPLGVRLGGFLLFPALDIEVAHNSNVFAVESPEEDDLVTRVKPKLSLESGWSRHGLILAADADIGRYNEFGNLDFDDYAISAEGRVDLRDSQLVALVQHDRAHRWRTDQNEPINAINPTEFTIDTFDLAYTYRPNRLIVRPRVTLDRFDFDDTRTTTGVINNDDQDRDVTTADLRLGYNVSADYALFLQGGIDSVDYDEQFDNEGFERSSEGYNVVFGSILGFSDITFGEAFVGYRSRDYDDPRYQTIDGPTFGIDLTWNVSGLTTVNGFGSQRIDPTTIIGAAGIDTTTLGVNVDHELLRNLILGLTFSTSTEDFDGIDREDDILHFRLHGNYLMNRYLSLKFGYDYQKRDNSGADAPVFRDYTIGTIFITLEGQI